MRNFKQIVWEDEDLPETNDPLLICYRDPANGALNYDCAIYEAGEWYYTDREGTFTNVLAWAYIPRCAFIYPYRRLGDE